MIGYDTRLNKVKKNFFRFEERLLVMFNVYYDGLVSKEDLKEISYLYDLIMFLVNKNVDFDIRAQISIPTKSGEIDRTLFTFEHFSKKLFVFIIITQEDSTFYKVEMNCCPAM